MTTDQNGAWLELQEVHSSLNYLKEKLNKTGQKISAAASQSPIEFNFTGLPSSLDSGTGVARTFRAAATSTSSLASPRRYQHSPRSRGKQSSLNGLFLPEPLSREQSHACAEPPHVNNGALLQRNELNFVRSLRQPNIRGNFVPSAAAITTAGNVTFTVGGVVTEHSVSTHDHHVKKACYINDETHKALKQSWHSGSKSFLGSSDRLHRLVEKQKRAAGHRSGKTKSPQHQTDRNANHVKASTSTVGAGGHSPRLVDAATFCKPRSSTVGTNTSVVLGHRPSEQLETTAVERGEHVSKVAASEASLNVGVPPQDRVDEYLEYLKRRTVGQNTGVKEQRLSVSAGGWERGLERDDIPLGSDRLGTDWEYDMSVDLVWKRKFASVREPKEYKGFSLGGDPFLTQQKARKLPGKADGPSDAPRAGPPAPRDTTQSGADNVEEPQPACPKTAEKGSGVHHSKPAAITTTSWKEGRDLALKKRGPYPTDVSAKPATLSGKQLKGGPTTDQAVWPTATGTSGDKHIVSCAARVAALRNLKRSQSVKRKAQNAMEQEEGSPAPATKVRHANVPAVHEFMVKQKLGRKMQKDNVERGAAEAARARQQRLEKLYAFQRKTARSSARIGREKVCRQQEDEEFVHQFVEHLKSMQDVVDGHHGQDVSSHAFFPGYSASAAAVDCGSPLQLRSQSHRDQEVQVGAAQVDSVASGKASQVRCSSTDTSSHSSPVSNQLHHLREDTSKDASELGSVEMDLVTSDLVDKEAPLEPEFHYEPTEQVISLGKLTDTLNQTLDEQLLLMSCDVSSQVPSLGEYQAANITERLCEVVTTFESSCLPQPDDRGSAFQQVPREQSLETAEKLRTPLWEQDEAARMIQHCFREYLARNVERTSETSYHEADLLGGGHALSCIPEESTIPQTDSSLKPSTSASRASLPGEEPSHHLMPSPNTIATVWKRKSMKTFLTSVQLDDEHSLPSISLRTVPPTGSTSPKRVSQHRALSAGLQEEEEAMPGGTSTEAETSLLEKDGERDSTLATDHKSAAISPLASRTETDSKRRQPEEAVGRVTNTGPATWPLPRREEAVVRVADQGPDRRHKHESTEASLLPASNARVSIGAVRAFSKPEPRLASLDNDRAWVLLEAQAKALQASAETARQLAQVRAPSLLELHGEDMVQRLTTNTVVAASALAAALASQRPDWQVPNEKDIQRRVDASSSSSTTSQPTDAGFESNDKTSPQSSTEESCSLPADNGRQAQEGQQASQQAASRTSADGSEKSNSSASVSEELDTLGFSDSSLDKRKLKASTSKKRQPKNVLPLSLDSSATEDSTGVGRKAHGWSPSSLSDPILLDRDLLSYGSLPERPLGPPGVEEGGDQRPLALLRLQERDLIERARADFTWIEVLKRNCRENGSEDLLPGLRKRQRGILIRLHQKRAELKALQSCCVAQARGSGLPSLASSATSVPTLVEPELPDGVGSATGGHSSVPSEHLEASLLSDLTSDQSKESSKPEEISSKVEQKSSLPNSYVSTFESSTSFFELPEDSTHVKLNASKRFLEERQQNLQSRRKHVQELLEWQKKLNAEEANVRALERRALTRLRVRGAKMPQGKSENSAAAAAVSSPAETSRSKSEAKSMTHPEDASFIEEEVPEEVSEEMDAEVTAATESVQEEEARTENTSGGQEESTIESKVGVSAASEAEVSTQTEGIVRSSSGSSSRKGLLLIKKPLVGRRKVRRDSSGSEDSFNVSLSETASDQSDIEGRILALSGELKKRQLEAEQLRREQRHRRTEVLREREQSLKKHIELYDQLIQQAKEELEKELDTAQHENTVYVKPQIKKPRAAEQRKHRLVEPPTAENNVTALVLHTKQSKPDKELPVETLTASSKSESKIVTEEEHSMEEPSFASSGAEESTAKGTTSSLSHKNTEESSSKATETSAGSEVVEELLSKEATESASSKSTVTTTSTSKVVKESSSEAVPASASPEVADEPVSGGTLPVSAKGTEEVPGRTAGETVPDVAAPPAVSTDALALETVPAACEDKTVSSGDDISEHISSAVSESVSPREESREKPDGEEQSARDPSQPASGKSESQNDTTSEGIPSSLGEIEAPLVHDTKDEWNQRTDREPSGEGQHMAEPPGEEASGLVEGGLRSVNVDEEASSLADSYTANSPGGPSSLEDESTAAEEVAEYTEEIVHSIVIDSSQSWEEAVEEGRVDRVVDDILRYLLEDTIKQLGSGQRCLALPAEDCGLPQEKFVQPADGRQEEEGSGGRLAAADISTDAEQAGAPLSEGATAPLERSTEDKLGDGVLKEDTLLSSDLKVEPAEAQRSEEVGQQWSNKEIDAIAKKLVSEAVDSVLAIARAKGSLAAASVQTDDPVSNVSHKVSVILASIEERRNSREFQRPQDLMVLSTDLDDEDFSWKDSSAAQIATLSEDGPSETSAKELCSRAVQAEDCFLSTTTEQDWFDDDFGLGSGDNALAYQRRIPNKPPPPYSPPKEGFLSKLFSEGAWKVPSTKAEVSALVRKAATAVYASAVQGTTFAKLTFSPEFAGERSGTFVMDADSHQAYCQFLFDLVKETAQELFCAEATDASPPPWQRNVRLRRKQPLPSTLDSFVSLVESKVMSVPGLHEDSELAFRNCGDRGVSFVDVLLYSEARSEEPDWVDYSREEVVVKDQVANAIFQLLLDDTLETLKSLWQVR